MDIPQGRTCAAALLACVPISIFATGCGKQVTLRQMVLEAAELRRTRAADHAELRQELARVEAERGLPLELAPGQINADTNAAAQLAQVVDPKLRNGILERTNSLFPDGEFQFTPLELAEIGQFLQKHQHRLQRVYAALGRPQCVFPIEYELGFFYEPVFIDDVSIACRLLSFEAAELLASGDVSSSLRPVEATWRLIGCLAKQKLLSARLRAAELRAEALLVLEAVANHPMAQATDLQLLSGVLKQHLEDWPPDADALIGDRAMTLHAYECIRLGLLQWILTSEEKKRFQAQLSFDSLPDVIARTIDHDEAFYLAAMRRHIELCTMTYFERRPELARLADELDASRQSSRRSSFPVLAATLFLPGIEDAHAIMARDRARCEAFAIALALASGREPPAYHTNPHHGGPFEVARESQRVVVQLNEPDERDVVIAVP